MKKYLILMVAVLMGLIVFPKLLGSSTDYYTKPIDAYNDIAGYSAATNTEDSASEEIGLVKFDETHYLFIGKIDNSSFGICELEKKDNKYKSKSEYSVYDINEKMSEDKEYTEDKKYQWGISFNHPNSQGTVESFKFNSKKTIYITVYQS